MPGQEGGAGVNRTLGRLGVAIVVHWDVSDPSPAGSGVLVGTVSILSRQRSRLGVWHESEWCSTRNGSRSTKWECDRRQIRNRARVVMPTDARLDRLSWSGARRDRGGWQGSRGRMGVVNDGFRISRPPSGFGLSLAVKRSARSTIEGLAGATVLAQMEQCPTCNDGRGSKSERTQTTGGKDQVDGQSGGSGVHS